MQTDERTESSRVRNWAVPAGCVLAAAGYAAVFLAHGRVLDAILAAAVMLVYGGLLLALSRRSEIAALLRGTGRDERRVLIDLRASALALYVVIIVSLVMAFIDLAGIVVFSRRT